MWCPLQPLAPHIESQPTHPTQLLSGRALTEDDTRISIQKIFHECSARIAEQTENAPAKTAFHNISEACEQFMTTGDFSDNIEFHTALHAFRARVAEQIEYLLAVYMVELTEPLIAVNLRDVQQNIPE